MSIAKLDRRVIIRRQDNQSAEIKLLSDLAHEQYVVLLGEPGLGKTEAFRHLAEKCSLRFGEASDWMANVLDPNGTYVIDAIDEVTIPEAREIAQALAQAQGCRWRISCRVEDWNAGGRLSKLFGIGMAAVAAEPVIAELQPLDEEEAVAVLTALQHPSPSTLMAKLRALNSTPFVKTPLGLLFLMDRDPESLSTLTRYDLYDSGVSYLAREHNPLKEEAQAVPSPQTILNVAGRIFLTLLLTGKHGIQRSASKGSTAVDLAELDLDSSQANATLDTALFTKKGEEFVPFHRSIQEFLAGRFLARLITDGLGNAKLHIERALALIVSPDGMPSEALKPLYAWLACHLVHQGAVAEAKRLVERDPDALLLHGDAAKLPWESRAHILDVMGQRDPYFRWTPDHWGPASSCTAGLITPELKDQVLSILDSDTSTHRLFTILEALSVGRPLPEMAESCWRTALRQNTVYWCKEIAIAAWAHCAAPSDSAVWEKVDELVQGHEELGLHRSRLIARLFCLIPPDRLTAQDVFTVLDCLHSVARSTSDHEQALSVSVPAFYAIGEISQHVAVPHLWRPLLLANPKHWRVTHGVGSLEARFAIALCSTVLAHSADITIDEFAKMTLATGNIAMGESTMGLRPAAAEWVAAKANQHDEIAKAVLLVGDEDVVGIGPIAAGLRGLGLPPKTEIVRWMLTNADLLEKFGPEYLGSQAAYWVLQPGEDAPAWLMSLFAELSDSKAAQAARQSVTAHTKELEDARSRRGAQIEDHLLLLIPKWAAVASLVESEEYAETLHWAAETYLGNSPLKLVSNSGPEALEEAFGEQLKQSMLSGLAGVLTNPLGNGRMMTKIASAAVLLEQQSQALRSLSTEQILEIFLATAHVRSARQKELVDSYCFDHLNQVLLSEPAALDPIAEAGDNRLRLLSDKLSSRLIQSPLHQWVARAVLTRADQFHEWALRNALKIACLNLEEGELVPIISAALSQPFPAQSNSILDDLDRIDRLWWAFIGVIVRPDLFAEDFTQCLDNSDDAIIRDQLVGEFDDCISGLSPMSTLATSGLLMRFIIQSNPDLGPYGGPQWPEVMKILRSISSQVNLEAGSILQGLIELSKGTHWTETLQHQLELHKRDTRAYSMKPISTAELKKVLSGKGPIDAQDLRALVSIVLEDIAAEMQPSPFKPWDRYWGAGKPKTENDCRDVLAEKLDDNLRQFGNFLVQPEVASSGGTRVDIQVTCGEFTVPIEAKRTSHSHLWFGHTGQLQTYALTLNAEGQGIYLVFWFGESLDVTASPQGVKPTTPQELKIALESELNPTLRATTSVIVLDVSDAASAAKARKENGYQAAKAAKQKP